MPAERNARALAKAMAGDGAAPVLLVELAVEAGKDVQTGHEMGAAVGWPLVWLEEYGMARTLLTWAVGVQRSGGSLRHLPQSLIELAELDFRVGRWVPALAEAYEAIPLYEETSQPTDRGFAQATTARIEAALGRDEDCRRHAQEGFAADAASGLLPAPAFAGAALGLLELGRGDPEAAIAGARAGRANRPRARVGEPWLVQWAPDLIEACSTSGTNSARGCWKRSSSRLGRPAASPRSQRRHDAGASSPPTRATRRRSRPPWGCTAACRPRSSAPTELAWGERRRRAGRRTQAREAERCAPCLRPPRCGRRGRARPRRAAGIRAVGADTEQRAEDTLTPQELQVAAIVAGGATNREAAAALFLSVKTIEFHLRQRLPQARHRHGAELARVVDAPA